VSGVVFAGVVRDCAPHLAGVLSNLDRLMALFDEAAFVFAENDSVDATKPMLKAWGQGKRRFSLLDLDGLGRIPARTVRLEIARNAYLEVIRDTPSLARFDYVCLLDMDEYGAYPVDTDSFRRAVDFLQRATDCAAVFCNQLGIYRDMWALRHPEYCPGDVWYEVLRWARAHGCSDDEAFSRTLATRLRSFDPGGAPLEVDSAFGGLGIYRLDYFLRSPNPYLGSTVRVVHDREGEPRVFRMQQCEHVHFNAGLRLLGGRLFILPSLINQVTPKLIFPSSSYRHMCF